MATEKLKKDSLSLFATLALSVAIMGPSASISVTVILMALYTGSSSPLVYIISMVCVGLISVSIIKLNQYFPSSGSVYHFAEKSLGKRAGFLSGWLIIFTYLMLGVSCAAIAASDFQGILADFGIRIHWELMVLVILVLVWYLAGRDAKAGTRMLLILEVVSMSMILLLSVVIILKTAFTTGLSLAPFQTGGNSLSSIASGVVFGFLAFSGFEGASSLGEESRNPKKTIPLAVAGAIILSGIFYILVSYAQILGFGPTAQGMQTLTASNAPLADLATHFLSGGVSLMIQLCVSVSFFSSTLGCVSAGARILYTMGRDRMLPKALGRIDARHQMPSAALKVLIAASFLIFANCFSLEAMDVGRYAATIGTLSLLLTYLFATLCAMVFFNKNKLWKGLRLILPILSALVLGAVLFLNIFPMPKFPLNLFPYIVLLWLAVGFFYSFSRTNRG